MQFSLRRPAILVALLGSTLLALPAPAQEAVRIPTVDGVELKGKFYAGKKNNAAVILLHAFENSSRSKDWVGLATALQKAGFSVLAFDFRGHGDSLKVDPALFWKHPANRNGIKNFKPTRDEIEAKDFKAEYRTEMINDIAAVKSFLDRKNDNGDCNTGQTIVIGAEEGATLGAIWLNAEWHRFKATPGMFGKLALHTHPEGQDVCACIWLSMAPKLGAAFSLERTLGLAGKDYATPMVFMHGGDDKDGATLAKKLEKYLKDPKAKEKHKFTGAHEIKGSKLAGSGLLKSTGTVEAITSWLDEVKLAKGKEWEDRDWRKNQYYWRTPGTGGMLIPARSFINDMGIPRLSPDLNLNFDTYSKFMAR